MQPGGSGADRTGPQDGSASITDPVRAPTTPAGPRPFTSTAGSAALCWLGALFTGPVAPVVMLALTWKDRSTPTRGHAIAASLVWSVMLAIYLPVFAVGIFWPSFDRDSGGPQPWALITAVSIAAITYTATATGLLITYRQWRRGAWR